MSVYLQYFVLTSLAKQVGLSPNSVEIKGVSLRPECLLVAYQI